MKKWQYGLLLWLLVILAGPCRAEDGAPAADLPQLLTNGNGDDNDLLNLDDQTATDKTAATEKKVTAQKAFIPIPLPIVNAGFEQQTLAQLLTPALPNTPHWKLYGAPRSSWRLVPGAQGKNALHLDRGWAMVETSVDNRLKGHSLTLQFKARGQGILKVWLEAFSIDANGKRNKFELKNANWELPLTDQFLPYVVRCPPIPAWMNIDRIRIQMGCYQPYAEVDAVSLTVGAIKIPPWKSPLVKTTGATRLEKIGAKEKNITRLFQFRSFPYATMYRRLMDDMPHTGVSLERYPGGVRAQEFEFYSPTPLPVKAFCFSLPSTMFSLFVDLRGDGKYEPLVQEPAYPSVGYWGRKTWPRYGVTFKKTGRIYGLKLINYAPHNQAIFEFRILAPMDALSMAAKKKLAEPQPDPAIPLLRPGKELPLPTPTPEQRYLQGFHVEPWMFDCPGWLKQKPRPPLAKWPPFHKMLMEMKRMHCSLIWLFPPKTWEEKPGHHGGGGYPYDVMWPSQYFAWSYPENLLQLFCNEMHRQHIRVFVQWRFPKWKKPKIATPKKTTPRPADILTLDETELDEAPQPVVPKAKKKTKPEMPIISRLDRERWQGVARELANSGVDGVPVCVDEQYFSPKYVHLSAENPVGRASIAAYKKRWHTQELPKKMEDSLAYRRYVIFQSEQIGEWMKGTARAAKVINPNVVTISNMVAVNAFNNNLKWGWPDIYGFVGDIDYLGTDPYHTMEDRNFGCYNSALTTKLLHACNRKRQSVVTLNFPWAWSDGKKKSPLAYAVYPPVSVYGSALGTIMNGGHALAFWRYNTAFLEGYDHYVEQVYAALDTLAAWGGKEAKLPRDIAVFNSTRSESWWRLKQISANGAFARNQTLGYDWFRWITGLLTWHDLTYELFSLDHPESWSHIARYKLIILPFPYSISRQAAAQLTAAAAKGTKIIIYGNPGATDEIGEPFAQPILQPLIDQGKADFVQADLLKQAHTTTFEKQNLRRIKQRTGTLSLQAETFGRDIQIGLLKKNTKAAFLFLINWSGARANAVLHLKMPAGRYYVDGRSMTGLHRLTDKEKTVFSHTDLTAFRLALETNAALILYVHPATDTSQN